MAEPVIDVINLTKRYADKVVLDRVNLQVLPGQVVALAGENGSGKTSLLEILMGLRPATSGSARVLGCDAAADPASARARIGFLSETVPFYPYFTIAETLAFHAAFFSDWDSQLAKQLLARLDLAPGARISTLSRGQKLRVGLVCAFAHRPALYLFDEVTAGMDPLVRADLFELLKEQIRDGAATVLFATNLLHQVHEIATHVVFLSERAMTTPEPVDATRANLELEFIRKAREIRNAR